MEPISRELWERFCRNIFSDRCMDPTLDIIRDTANTPERQWAYQLAKKCMMIEYTKKVTGPVESKHVELTSVINKNLYFCLRVLHFCLKFNDAVVGTYYATKEFGMDYTCQCKVKIKM